MIERTLRRLARGTQQVFRISFADGSSWQNLPGEPELRLHFKTAAALWRVAAFGHVGVLESYFDGTLEVEGDFALAFRIAYQSRFAHRPGALVRLRNRWHELRFGNRDLARAKRNARFHYGLGADFYGAWLDQPLLMYTCGYWPEGTDSVEQAQRNKIDHVCRKLALRDGDRVVDIGCGFGGFMFRAQARHAVRICGINTATEQVDWLRARILERGLADRLEVREADFREVHAQFDKLVSIGVLEHAGRDQLREVVQAHADFLAPGGLGLLHFIGHVGVRDTEFFIRRHVFPGGWIPSLAQTLTVMEECGLEIVDVENLRRHYALTLDAWAERFDANWDRIHAIDPQRFDDRFRRVWRTYLYGCAEMFRSPHCDTHLFQIVFSKGNLTATGYPMSRRFLYTGDAIAEPAPATAAV
jgi:cyclopropane-fatty-acyl-phospholipid synthase